jgi:hypothetical protein
VAVGVTTATEPVIPPGFQVYELAPLPVRVADDPAQRLPAVEAMVSVGKGLTVTFTTAVPVHPTELVVITV